MGDLVGLPAWPSENAVSRREIACILGVSESTVKRMVRDGMPSVTYGRRVRRFRPSTCVAWAVAQRKGS